MIYSFILAATSFWISLSDPLPVKPDLIFGILSEKKKGYIF